MLKSAYIMVLKSQFICHKMRIMKKELKKLELYRCVKRDKEKLATLNKIFSRIAVGYRNNLGRLKKQLKSEKRLIFSVQS